MTKRIIICCDGTWNELEAMVNNRQVPTNVLKLVRAVTPWDEGNGIVHEIITRMQKRAGERAIRINCSVQADLRFISDPRMMQQMLRNLVANAVESYNFV